MFHVYLISTHFLTGTQEYLVFTLSTYFLTGTPECFLFSLSPHYGVYTTTGYNENYMYLNQGQETLPNGLVSTVLS